MSLSPINTLPAELLVEIFTVTADCDLPSACSLGWVRVSHVCRRWRHVIVQVHRLWARILAAFPCSDTAHRIILERANSAPLTFWPSAWRSPSPKFIDSDHFLSESAREVARHNIHRTAALAHADVRDSEDWATLLGGRTLPHLSKLELISGSSNIRLDFSAFVAPKLRTLVFENVFVRFTAPALRSLTLWADCDKDPRHSIPLDELLIVLEPCPDLEELDLNQAVHASVVPSDRFISLPRLKTLRFRGAEDIFSSLWAHLDAPSCEYLHLVLPFAAHSLSNIPLIRPLLQHPAHDTLQISLSPLTLPTVSFELFVGSSAADYQSFSGRCSGRGVSVLFEHKTRSYYDNEPLFADTTRTAALAAVIAQLDTPNIRIVDLAEAHLSVVGLDRQDPLNTALAGLTNIDTVVLSLVGGGDCFNDLARLTRVPIGAPPLFPMLSRLAFQHPSARHRSQQMPSTSVWLARNRASLRAYLSACRDAGHALAHIAARDGARPDQNQDRTAERELEHFRAAVAHEVADLLAAPPRRVWPLFSLAPSARATSALLRRPARMYPRVAVACVSTLQGNARMVSVS